MLLNDVEAGRRRNCFRALAALKASGRRGEPLQEF